MEQVIAISLSSDVTRLLADNEIDLLKELNKKKLSAKRAGAEVTVPTEDVGLKSVALIILVSAAAAPMVASAIAQIIDAISRNKRAAIAEKEGKLPPSSTRTYKASFLGLKVELTEKQTG